MINFCNLIGLDQWYFSLSLQIMLLPILMGQLIFSGFSPDDENLFFSPFTIISDRNHNIPTGKLQLATNINKVINFIGETHLLVTKWFTRLRRLGREKASLPYFCASCFHLWPALFATSLLSESLAQAMQPAKRCLASEQQNSARTQPPGQSYSRYLWVMSCCTTKHSPILWGDIPS